MRTRPVVSGKTYLITRRCSDRRFFLRPSDNVNAIFWFALGNAAEIASVQVHAVIAMSNHIHLLVTDRLGVLPVFMHALDLEVAKAVSAEIGRWGGLWEAGTYSRVDLLDDEAVIDALTYVHANPVSAGLVPRAKHWPGVTTATMAFGDVVVARRPETAYYERRLLPPEFKLTLEPPPGFDPNQLLKTVKARVRELEKAKKLELSQANRKFVGARRVLLQDPYDNPTSWEKRRGRDPTFKSKDKWKRIEAIQRKRTWYAAYRDALRIFRSGFRDVFFPAGTWAMPHIYGCNCSPAPT